MARKAGLGSTAAQVIAIGDIDALVSRKGHQEILDGIEKVELAQADTRSQEYVGQIDIRITELKKHLDMRAERRAWRNADRQDQVRYNNVWREAGIRSRFVFIDAPVIVRVVAWLLFAAVDFYLFATAMTIALNEDNQDPNGLLGFSWGFWTGGVMGLMVFALGVVLGHLVRQSDYIRAQQELRQELRAAGDVPPGLVLNGNSVIVFGCVGTLFVILTVATLLVRAEGVNFKWSWPLDLSMVGPLVMQMLVPFVAVGVEAVMYDPTRVRMKRANWLDFYLERKLRRHEATKAKRELEVRGYRETIQARYDTERATLKTFHDSQGFAVDGEITDELG